MNKSKRRIVGKGIIDNLEVNRIKVADRRGKIKKNLAKAAAGGRLNLKSIGVDGQSLMGLNLKGISNQKKKRILSKLVAAAGRKK